MTRNRRMQMLQNQSFLLKICKKTEKSSVKSWCRVCHFVQGTVAYDFVDIIVSFLMSFNKKLQERASDTPPCSIFFEDCVEPADFHSPANGFARSTTKTQPG